MTGSSSKLLQIQGKWYQDRKKKQNLRQKKTKPEAKKYQKLFYTLGPGNSGLQHPCGTSQRPDGAGVGARILPMCGRLEDPSAESCGPTFSENLGAADAKKDGGGGMPSETYLETSEGKKHAVSLGKLQPETPPFQYQPSNRPPKNYPKITFPPWLPA